MGRGGGGGGGGEGEVQRMIERSEAAICALVQSGQTAMYWGNTEVMVRHTWPLTALS